MRARQIRNLAHSAPIGQELQARGLQRRVRLAERHLAEVVQAVLRVVRARRGVGVSSGGHAPEHVETVELVVERDAVVGLAGPEEDEAVPEGDERLPVIV